MISSVRNDIMDRAGVHLGEPGKVYDRQPQPVPFPDEFGFRVRKLRLAGLLSPRVGPVRQFMPFVFRPRRPSQVADMAVSRVAIEMRPNGTIGARPNECFEDGTVQTNYAPAASAMHRESQILTLPIWLHRRSAKLISNLCTIRNFVVGARHRFPMCHVKKLAEMRASIKGESGGARKSNRPTLPAQTPAEESNND